MSTPSGYKQYRLPSMSPEQVQLFNQLLGGLSQSGPQALNQLSQLASGQGQAFNDIQKPALNQFNQQIIPGIAARFAGKGALNSSAFQNAAAGAAGNLADSLAAQRAQIQQNALQSLLGLQSEFLNMRPYEYGLQQKRTGWDKFRDILGMGTGIANTVASFL